MVKILSRYLVVLSKLLRSVFLLSITVSSLGLSAEELCPKVKNVQSIQDQFQLILHSTPLLTPLQEEEIQKISKVNEGVIEKIKCFADHSEDTNNLADFLAALKLEVLQIRFHLFKQNDGRVKKELAKLRDLENILISKPHHLSRRLAASVRSLYLDELERMYESFPATVRAELSKVYLMPAVGFSVEQQMNMSLSSFVQEIKKLKTSEELATYFGKRPWKNPSDFKNRLSSLLVDLKLRQGETLEAQLGRLFRLKKVVLDSEDLERVVNYYTQYVVSKIKENPFLSIGEWMHGVVEEHLASLRKDLGVAWPLVSGLAGVSFEGKLHESNQNIELLDEVSFKQAQKDFLKTQDPLGRLYQIVLLKQLEQLWTDLDVTQLSIDLNRVSLLKTAMAAKEFRGEHHRWPTQIQELVKKEYLDQVPKDYFTGEPLQYSSARHMIWSRGENRNDEYGRGDDLSIIMSK